MRYFLISPFSGKNNGITNYTSSACELLVKHGIDASIIDNNEGLKPIELERKIKSLVPENSIVEIPDAWGLFHNTETSFHRHVRLHAPSLLLQEINGTVPNKERFNRETRSIVAASVVSSPSVRNTDAYNMGLLNVLNFPNPIPYSYQNFIKKDIDVIFIGRADKVKGIDLLIKILSHLPSGMNVAILGVSKDEVNKLSFSYVKCNVKFWGWVSNDEKLVLLRRSKVCTITSRFESYSLVAAEAISCACHVITWDVGGVSECYPSNLLCLVAYDDIVSYAAAILDKITLPPPERLEVIEFIESNNNKYVSSIRNIINGIHSNNVVGFNNRIYSASKESIRKAYETSTLNYLRKGINVFGFSMMNEHAQEMWGSLIGHVIKDYRFISIKPLNYNSKFNEKFPISPDKFIVYDWRFDTSRLVNDSKCIENKITFIFNGNTTHFDTAIDAINKSIKSPIVYSELGWFPQNGHIYFDSMGANYRSSIRLHSLERLTHKYDYSIEYTVLPFKFNAVLLALQLPGDTTLNKESYPLQLAHNDLISFVRSIIPKDIKIIVRKHPRDKNDYQVELFENIVFDEHANAHDTLTQVDALISVNSTVILEALNYPINIYTLGHGLFENKNIVFTCHDGDLESKWINYISYNKERRHSFISYLKERQLLVSDMYKYGDVKGNAMSLYPIVESIMNFSSENNIHLPSQVICRPLTEKNSQSTARNLKKLRKLFSMPKKFTQDMVIKNQKSLKPILQVSSKINSWLFSDLIKPLVAKKKIGSELDSKYRSIKPIEKYIPEIAFLYYRTKWIYFGVNKDMVKFSKSTAINKLSAAMRFDVAAILCESGNYRDAIKIAKSCLNEQPNMFRFKQYLRLASIISNDKIYLESLPPDELTYITELRNCFLHILKSRLIVEDLIVKNKSSIKVIGNSPNQRGIKKGKEINNSGLVIRFNSFDTSLKRRADVGLKTDIWVKSPSFEEVERKSLPSIKSVIITGTNHLDRSPSAYDFFYDFYKSNIPCSIIPQEIYHELSRKISSPPSGGIQILYWLKEVNGRCKENSIYGFSLNKTDALKGPNGDINQKIKYSHNWSKEIEIIKSECLG